MKKIALTFLIVILVGLSSASNLPYDGMTLNYERDLVQEHSEFPSLNKDEQEEITLLLSETSEGYKIERSGVPDLMDINVEQDETLGYWLNEHNISTGEELEISNNSYTITSTSTEIDTDAFGSIKVIEAVYDSYSSEKTLGGNEVSDYSVEYRNYYHPTSGLLLRDKREITGTQTIDGQPDNVIESIQTQEIAKNGVDSDGDSLTDLEELIEHRTDPTMEDTDQDGLSDRAEIEDHNTNPMEVDTDNDNLTDEEEVNLGTDPTKADTDNDGLNDGREQELGTDPSEEDSDGDGVEDQREIELSSDPTKADTDQDNLDDGREVELGTNLTVVDTDEDGIQDGREVEIGTSPVQADTDGDYWNDQIDPLPANPLLPNGGLAAVLLAGIGGFAYRRKS